MPFEVSDGEGAAVLTLSGRVGVQQAASLWDALRKLGEWERVLLSAERLEEIDTSTLQILCRLGGRLQVGAVSDAFFTALHSRGMESLFAVRPAETELGRESGQIAA